MAETLPTDQLIANLRLALEQDHSLTPVVTTVGQDRKRPDRQKRYRARYLDLDRIVEGESVGGDYLDRFGSDAARLSKMAGGDYSAFHFAQKYGSRIGAGTTRAPEDASFFDHLRVEQAMAAGGNTGKYFLLKGDLTGIQSFLYADMRLDQAGGAAGVSKRLRGKSFLIGALTDLIADCFLDALGLPYWNLLFAGGGHFNILARDDEDSARRIDQLSRALNLFLLDTMRLHLGLAVARVACGDDLVENAGVYFQALNRERDMVKHAPFRGYLSEVFKQKAPRGLADGTFENIGRLAPRTEYLLQVTAAERLSDGDGVSRLFFLELPEPVATHQALYAVSGDEPVAAVTAFLQGNSQHIARARLIRLNSTDFLTAAGALPELSFPLELGFRFVGKETPATEDGPMDFETLATQNCVDEEPLYVQLAAMRLDVDDLGLLFSQGFGARADLRRIAALSREINLFFAGHFNRLARQYQVYIVYSGGDDAFIVGSWLNLMHFARALQEDFNRFTFQNDQLHFSGGIFLCDEHYPVARFADDAKRLEAEAKSADREKNRLAIFNHVLPWRNFSAMMEYAPKLMKYTGSGETGKDKLAKSLVYRLLYIIKSSFYDRDMLDEGEIRKKGEMRTDRFYRNLANLKYMFARHGFTDQKVEEAENELTRDIIRLFLRSFDQGDVVKDYTVALHYVLLKLRKPRS